MNDITTFLICAVVAALASFAFGRLSGRRSRAHDDASYAHGRTDAEAEAKTLIMEAESRGYLKGKDEGFEQGKREGELAASQKIVAEFARGKEEGRREILSDYEVKITPFCRSTECGMAFWKSFEIETGYTYQLFVRGMPCLQPHETIIKTSRETEFDPDKLVELTGKIVREAIASSNPAGITMKVAETIPLYHK